MRSWLVIIVCFLYVSVFSQDIWPPDVPKIDSVSVYDITTGAVIISWFPCDSPDVAGYRIYRSINALWQPIADVPAPATSYIDNAAAGNFHPELYRIAAYDNAGNLSAMTPENQYHNTIYVFPYLDSINCHFAIRLNWNRYLNWFEGVNEYRIYVSENFGPFALLATVNGATNQYYHMDVNDNTSYCYIIRAISNQNKTSTSNKTCYFTDLPALPQYINADYATVVDNNKILVSFTLDTMASICRYQLQRATDDINYQPIAFFDKCRVHKFTYTDQQVDVTKHYYYRLLALDACGQIRESSNIASNIVVTAWATEDVQNKIIWNEYQTWISGIDSIYLYRIIGDNQEEVIFSSHNIGQTTYIDDLTNAVLANPSISNKFCYFVEQVENDGNPHNVKGRSRSNIACTYQPSRVFLPNTFTPDGDELNAYFKPSIAFANKEGYVFRIFDRWGFKVFETTDLTQGWDGKHEGKLCPAGMYTYYLMYKTLDGTTKEKAGAVYLYFP